METNIELQGSFALTESIEEIYRKRLPDPETGLFDVETSLDDLAVVYDAFVKAVVRKGEHE